MNRLRRLFAIGDTSDGFWNDPAAWAGNQAAHALLFGACVPFVLIWAGAVPLTACVLTVTGYFLLFEVQRQRLALPLDAYEDTSIVAWGAVLPFWVHTWPPDTLGAWALVMAALLAVGAWRRA